MLERRIFMRYPLEAAIQKYLDPRIPAWGEAEEEIDPPAWAVSDVGCDPALPGEGLKRHTMLYIGEGNNRMYLIHDGRVVWTFDAGKGWEYDDIWMLQTGNILFSRMYWAAEITPDKRFVWRLDAPEGAEIHTVQPIGPERVLMAVNALPLPRAWIVNKRTGAIEYDREIPYAPLEHPHGQFRRFRMTAEGTFLAPCLSMDRVIEYDRDMKPVWTYSIPGPWAAVRLKNGNTLITGEQQGVTREVNRRGDTVWEFYLDELPEPWRPDGTQSCVRLDNGNTLICSRGGGGKTPQLVEIAPDKQVVWVLKDWKNLGPCTAVQVLTESGAPEEPGACAR